MDQYIVKGLEIKDKDSFGNPSVLQLTLLNFLPKVLEPRASQNVQAIYIRLLCA